MKPNTAKWNFTIILGLWQGLDFVNVGMICVRIHMHVHTHTYTSACARTRTHTHTHIHTFTHPPTHKFSLQFVLSTHYGKNWFSFHVCILCSLVHTFNSFLVSSVYNAQAIPTIPWQRCDVMLWYILLICFFLCNKQTYNCKIVTVKNGSLSLTLNFMFRLHHRVLYLALEQFTMVSHA